MKIIGLTGGIGSGKSTIAKLFQALGVPVYIADSEAKKILASSKDVRKKIVLLLGAQSYTKEMPNRAYIAQKVFNDPLLLDGLNAIVHPEVTASFNRWVQKQDAPYCVKEAAILFENGGFTHCDATILVTAPREVRVQRVLSRDTITLADVNARMENQWEDQKKIPLANYVIENIDLTSTKIQVQNIHKKLLSTCISSL